MTADPRRQHARVSYYEPIVLVSEGDNPLQIHARVRDISPVGLYVLSDEAAPAPGTQLRAQIARPEASPITAAVRVVRVGGEREPRGFAVALLSGQQDVELLIGELIAGLLRAIKT